MRICSIPVAFQSHRGLRGCSRTSKQVAHFGIFVRMAARWQLQVVRGELPKSPTWAITRGTKWRIGRIAQGAHTALPHFSFAHSLRTTALLGC
eukprot:1394881-Amorphochlora_amoeboformis.AAC.2